MSEDDKEIYGCGVLVGCFLFSLGLYFVLGPGLAFLIVGTLVLTPAILKTIAEVRKKVKSDRQKLQESSEIIQESQKT